MNDKTQPAAISLSEFRSLATGDNWEPLIYVNANPDSDYPMRILQAHYENATNGRWVSESPVAAVMNQAQEERARILYEFIQQAEQLKACREENERWEKLDGVRSELEDSHLKQIDALQSDNARKTEALEKVLKLAQDTQHPDADYLLEEIEEVAKAALSKPDA